MELLHSALDFFLHLDAHLGAILASYGSWTYAILFLIVFCETGLVITPFLPGDSLLFAVGALAATSGLDIHTAVLLLIVAAILGDGVNYAIGAWAGPWMLSLGNGKLIRKEYLERTERFYQRYGGKTIIFARFVPIIRTFAPFLAGIGSMKYSKFLIFNIVGGVAWVSLFSYAGYIFGNLPFIKKNFTLAILAVIVVSLIPPLIEAYREQRRPARP